MTNSEAITYIREWLKDEYALNDKDKEVLNMAAEVLEQEPTLDKPHIKGDYYDGFKNGLRKAKWDWTRMRTEIATYHNPDWSMADLIPISEVLKLIDKYKE